MLRPLIFTVIGLALLLTGMRLLRRGLEMYAGSHFQQILLRLTATPSKGFISGMIATGVLQSSTALTVMTVSFVDARLILFHNALGLILGSNIGTTITPQLLAFPLSKISIWLILPGFIGYLVLKKKTRFLLLSFAGLGMMFFSLSVLEAAMLPLMEMTWVQDELHRLDNSYFFSMLAGTFLSALLHSSSAATSIAMVLTKEGWLNLPAALALIMGANIGTCFTALIVSFFASRAAQRVALFHVLLNVFGMLIFFPFLTLTADLISLLGGNLSRQVANMHTLFNVTSSLLMLPLLPYASRLLEKIR